jgi:Recombination endonuclease VII
MAGNSLCALEDCTRAVVARGWCAAHYARWRRHGDPSVVLITRSLGALCSVPDCPDNVHARGWCDRHYQHWRKNGDPVRRVVFRYEPEAVCIVTDCDRRPVARNWCRFHYNLWRKYGDPSARRRFQAGDKCFYAHCGLIARSGGPLCRKHYLETYASLHAEQEGRCAICAVPEMLATRQKLYLDHDHLTGRPRQLLCHACNSAIGYLGDDPARLHSAIAYLERWETAQSSMGSSVGSRAGVNSV